MTMPQLKGDTVSDPLNLGFADLCLLTPIHFWEQFSEARHGLLVGVRMAKAMDGDHTGMFLAFANFRNLSRKDCPAFASSISDDTNSPVSSRLVASNMAFTGPIDAADIDRPR